MPLSRTGRGQIGALGVLGSTGRIGADGGFTGLLVGLRVSEYFARSL